MRLLVLSNMRPGPMSTKVRFADFATIKLANHACRHWVRKGLRITCRLLVYAANWGIDGTACGNCGW